MRPQTAKWKTIATCPIPEVDGKAWQGGGVGAARVLGINRSRSSRRAGALLAFSSTKIETDLRAASQGITVKSMGITENSSICLPVGFHWVFTSPRGDLGIIGEGAVKWTQTEGASSITTICWLSKGAWSLISVLWLQRRFLCHQKTGCCFPRQFENCQFCPK